MTAMKRLLALGALMMGCGGGSELSEELELASTEHPTLPVAQAPAFIERDRMYMAAQPGVLFKYLPLTLPTSADPYIYSGGRYLVDTVKHAQEYAHWVIHEYQLDGVRFPERSYFVQTECKAYSVIGIKDFKPLRSTHHVVRTERFAFPEGDHRGYLEARGGQGPAHPLAERARAAHAVLRGWAVPGERGREPREQPLGLPPGLRRWPAGCG
jgi:hypothetical protein